MLRRDFADIAHWVLKFSHPFPSRAREHTHVSVVRAFSAENRRDSMGDMPAPAERGGFSRGFGRGDRGGDRGGRGRGDRGPRRAPKKDEDAPWVPTTKLGRLVQQARSAKRRPFSPPRRSFAAAAPSRAARRYPRRAPAAAGEP